MSRVFNNLFQRLFKIHSPGQAILPVSPGQVDTTEKEKEEALELLYTSVNERLSIQKEQWMALDVKVNFILGYATALISASLVLQAVLISLPDANKSIIHSLITLLPEKPVSILLMMPLLLFYIVTVILGIFAYKPRSFRVVPDPEVLFIKWLNKEELQMKQVLLRNKIEAFQLNEAELGKKVRLIDFALGTLFIEAFLLVPLILFQLL